MRHILILLTVLWFVPSSPRTAEPDVATAQNWPQWRGPHGNGVAPIGDPPVEWGEDRNIRWKVGIPGTGYSSPIVWGDRVFVTTAIRTGHEVPGGPNIPAGMERGHQVASHIYQFLVLAISRRDGSILWQRVAREEAPVGVNQLHNSWASHSPVTDGRYVYAYFGSNGLYCYDMEGTLQWERDLGDMNTARGNGEGNSPVLHGDRIIINWDHEGASFIVALDKRTGDQLWMVPRDETTSWSSPFIVEHDGRHQIIVSATNRVCAYDPVTGALIWECAGLKGFVIPTPVTAHGIVYAMSGHQRNALLAIRLAGAQGDISGSDAILWQDDRNTSYVSSPLVYDDALYFLKHSKGFLSRLDAMTGRQSYIQRLPNIRDIFASPVAARDRIYLVDRDGNALVIRHGPEFEVLAQNKLDDGFEASPAVVDRELYLRGRTYLYCIAED
jgi:outer membrane protein assembly factor BamB